jgi:3'(2'), 5'-bisphosphate nucleotidase
MYLKKELEVAKQLAVDAGKIALRLRNKLTITDKPDAQGPVTNADIMIDEFICHGLKKLFPQDKIISEESFIDHKPILKDKRIWFIDPIDGTKNYVAGGDDFVIMIGLVIDGIARLGVIFQPTHNILWAGIFSNIKQQNIAFKIENKQIISLFVIHQEQQINNFCLLASRISNSLRQKKMISLFLPHKIIYRSSVGLKAMLVLEKSARFYVAWSNQIKLWDTCAPAAILQAANATISFIDGRKLSYSGSINHGFPIIMANFSLDAKFLTKLKNIAEQKL